MTTTVTTPAVPGIEYRPRSAALADAATHFAEDVAKHEMTVARDDGLYRHLQFRQPGTSTHWFDVITWPGALTVHGDMGTYVFARTRHEDMLKFFRSSAPIDPDYWAQKMCAADGVKEYSSDVFTEQVVSHLSEWVLDMRESGGPEQEIEAMVAAVRTDVLAYGEDEVSAREALDDFSRDGLEFSDTWEWDLRKFTFRFLWCCHAVRWAVIQYDARATVPADEVAAPAA